MKLNRDFYLNDDVTTVARSLLGKHLMVKTNGGVSGGIIVESEAYCGSIDKASHAYKNKMTDRTKIMFGKGGRAYVYLCYGIHYLFNVVTNIKDRPDAVLIRAIEPIIGINKILDRRNASRDSITLTNGPAKLSQGLGINLYHNGMDLLGDEIWIEEGSRELRQEDIVVSKRIGVDYAGEDANLPWRYYIKGNDWISKI